MHVVAVNKDNGLNEKELDLFEEIICETFFCFNPFTAPACKIFGAERCSDWPAKQYVCSRIEMLCLLMKILSLASAKKKTKKLKGFKCRTFVGHFQVISWQ